MSSNIPHDSEPPTESLCMKYNWDNIFATQDLGGISVLSMNMRSMQNKFTKFLAHLAYVKEKFTFILLTEIWVNRRSDYLYDIEGYDCLHFMGKIFGVEA